MTIQSHPCLAALALASVCLLSCADGRGAVPARAPESTAAPEVAPSPPKSGEPSVAEGTSEATKAACLSDADCAGGVCEGEGCGDDAPGHCAPRVRPCTKDLATYCSCDGRTFRGSGSCPGRRYAHRGACQEAPAAEEP